MTSMSKKKILELFAGSCSVGNVAKQAGHEVFTSDIESFGGGDRLSGGYAPL